MRLAPARRATASSGGSERLPGVGTTRSVVVQRASAPASGLRRLPSDAKAVVGQGPAELSPDRALASHKIRRRSGWVGRLAS